MKIQLPTIKISTLLFRRMRALIGITTTRHLYQSCVMKLQVVHDMMDKTEVTGKVFIEYAHMDV